MGAGGGEERGGGHIFIGSSFPVKAAHFLQSGSSELTPIYLSSRADGKEERENEDREESFRDHHLLFRDVREMDQSTIHRHCTTDT